MSLSRNLLLALTATLALAACGQSRLNPMNWGSSKRVDVQQPADGGVNTLLPKRTTFSLRDDDEDEDNRVLVSDVTQMRVEQTPSGAIVYATGVAARQGAYSAELRPLGEKAEPDENGVLTLDFVVAYPSQNTPVGGTSLRQVHTARSLSKQTLETTKLIRVGGANGARETRRN